MFVQIKNQIRMQIASSLFFSLSLSISISHSLHSSLRVTNHTFPYPSSPNFPLFPPSLYPPPFNHLASNTPLINTPTKNQREKLTLSGFASHQAWRRRKPKPPAEIKSDTDDAAGLTGCIRMWGRIRRRRSVIEMLPHLEIQCNMIRKHSIPITHYLRISADWQGKM